MSETIKTFITPLQKEGSWILPTARNYSLNGEVSAVRSNHNVHDLLPTLPLDTLKHVVDHYGTRAIHHLFGSRPGDVLMIPMPESHTNRVAPLASWIQKNTGVNVAFIPQDPRQLPLAAGATVVGAPYYKSYVQEELMNQNSPYHYETWGPKAEHSEQLKSKRRFHELITGNKKEIETLLHSMGVEGNSVLPYEISKGKEQTISAVSERLASIAQMYSEVAQYLQANENSKDASLIANYEPGVVLRLAMGDGAFGTLFVKQVNGDYEVSYEKDKYRFSSEQELNAFLTETLGDDEYILTRMVDVLETPSVGVYLNEGEVQAMPITTQFMKNGSCVGGGSNNSSSNGFMNHVAPYAKAMQALSTAMTYNYTGGAQKQGHIGFDYIIAGEKERLLCQVVETNPYLAAKTSNVRAIPYGKEVTDLAIVESNPRFTSLSLTVWPILMTTMFADLKAGNRDNTDVTVDDIAQFYGRVNGAGESGAFAVWDYVNLPPLDELQTYNRRNGTGNLESMLVDYIDAFNAHYAKQGIFLVPRITVEQNADNPQQLTSSVGIGMKPTAVPENLAMFKQLVAQITEHGLTTNLLSNSNYFLT